MTHLKWIIPLLILTLVVVPAPTQAEELEASIEVLEGGVEVMQAGSKDWTTLRTDAFVSTGDRVRTDEEGIALITWFEDGSFMELQPNSEMVIEEFTGDDETFVIDASLIEGSLFNSVRRLLDTDSRYQINTPSQTATVRGTVFAVDVNKDQETAIFVLEGTVHAEHIEDIELFIPVTAGQMVVIGVDGVSANEKAFSIEDAPEEYAELIDALTVFFENLQEEFGEVADTDTDADADTDVNDNASNDNNGVGNGVGGGQDDNRSVNNGDNNPGQGSDNNNAGGNGGGKNK